MAVALDDEIEKLKTEATEYEAKVNKRYDDLYTKMHWDIVDFFQKPEEYGTIPGHSEDLINHRAKHLVEEYHKAQKILSNLRDSMNLKEIQLANLKRAKELKSEAEDLLDKLRKVVYQADRELQWYSPSWDDMGRTSFKEFKRIYVDKILDTDYSDISENGLRDSRIKFWMQVKFTASALNDCLNAIVNKEGFRYDFQQEQDRRNREREKWFREHPGWFEDMLLANFNAIYGKGLSRGTASICRSILANGISH